MATVKPSTINQVWADTGTTKIVSPAKYNSGWLLEVADFGLMNSIQQDFSKSIKHNNEEGINVWDNQTAYPQNAYVKGSDGNVYRANTANNGKDPTTSTEWDKWGEEFQPNVTLPFYMDSAPLGWVQDTSVNDSMMVVVSGGGGYTAGNDSAISPHNHTVTSHIHSTAGAVLTTSQLPWFQLATGWGSTVSGPHGNHPSGAVNLGTGAAIDTDNYQYMTSPVGANAPHYHGNTGPASPATSFNHTPKYHAMIICTKS